MERRGQLGLRGSPGQTPGAGPAQARGGSAGRAREATAGVISGRRSSRTNLRAVVGGVALAAGAVAVFGASLSAGHPSGALYVVAARELPAGSVIGPGDITTARAAVPSGSRAGLFRDPDSVVGRSLTVTVSPGEFIQSEVLATASSSPLRPVSLAVDSNSVVALAPGDRVDVLEAPAAGASGSAPPVTVVLRGASLISLARPSTGLLAGSTSSTVVTLGVGDLAAVQDVVQASRAGTVELVLAEPADGSGPGPVATPTPTTTGGTGGTGGTGDTSGVGG